jgi:hypothetical protein
MTDPVPPVPAAPSAKKLIIGSTVVVAVATIALVVFILPAEYGIDPTGAGDALGITQLSGGEENIYLERGQARENVLFSLDGSAEPNEALLRKTLTDNGIAFPANATINSDRYKIELLPYEGIELKYVLAQGAPMIFAWRATAQVNYDMHAHPFEGGVDLTESYAITDAPAQTAVYVAPFTGIHGWYWQNRTLEPVTLTLDATGAFTGSKIFDPAGEHDRPLAPPGADAEGEEVTEGA